jgi:hypothetical protein
MNQDAFVGLVRGASGAGLALALAAGQAPACQGPLAGGDSATIVRLTVAQVTNDRLAVGLPVPTSLGPQHLSIECIDSVGAVRIYRVTPWILEHWHPYLVATSAIGVHPLGGFPAPDPRSVVAQASLAARSKLDAERIARVLARLLDPNGSGDVAFARDSLASNELRVAWRRAARRGFPPDTTVSTITGGTQVRMTVLSHLSRQYPAAWQVVTFVFEFAPSGQLVGWAIRAGESSFAVEAPG